MKIILKRIIRFYFYEPFLWIKNGFMSPAPFLIKKRVFIRHAIKTATWIETGTYLGDTTSFLNKYFGVDVYSIEPSEFYFQFCQKRFYGNNQIKLIHGSSEDMLVSVLENINNEVNFWLDGHFSSGKTFQGESDTSINRELDIIENNLKNLKKVTIFIDDIREFGVAKDYPPLDTVVNWAHKNNFKWTIEHDILIAKYQS